MVIKHSAAWGQLTIFPLWQVQQDFELTNDHRFQPSPNINTGNLLLYGQGTISKRNLNVLEERGGKGNAIGLTVAICVAAIVAMIAGAPVTFGLSLLGIPAEIQICLAAGIVISVIGFAVHGSESGQRNPVGVRKFAGCYVIVLTLRTEWQPWSQ